MLSALALGLRLLRCSGLCVTASALSGTAEGSGASAQRTSPDIDLKYVRPVDTERLRRQPGGGIAAAASTRTATVDAASRSAGRSGRSRCGCRGSC